MSLSAPAHRCGLVPPWSLNHYGSREMSSIQLGSGNKTENELADGANSDNNANDDHYPRVRPRPKVCGRLLFLMMVSPYRWVWSTAYRLAEGGMKVAGRTQHTVSS